MIIRKTTWIISLLLLTTICIHAQNTGNGKKETATAKPLPLDTAVRTAKLANGFTYYIRRNTEPQNRVVLYLVNKVGSILETEEQRGIAHFMEHMSFNGTKHFPKNELVDYLQKAGVRFGADLNAYTSFDETVYQLPVPSNDPALLANSFQIMRDWAQDALLDPSEIEKERGVIMEEKRLRKGAGDRMSEQYLPVIFNGSRYAQRLPIGTEDVILKAPAATFKNFYHDWYRPDLQALIVVGDIDVNAVEKTIRSKFADLINPQNRKTRTKYTIPLTGKKQFIKVTDKEYPQTTAEIMIKHPGTVLITDKDYREQLVRSLFNQMLGARFGELSKQADPPFLGGSASIGGFLGNLNAFSASVTAKPGELEKGIKVMWTEVQRAKKYGFTESELNRVKESYSSSMRTALNEKDKTPSASYVNEYVNHFLKAEASPGIEAEFKLVQAYLPGISLAEVNSLAKKYITSTNTDILIMAPAKDSAVLPGELTVNTWLHTVEQSTIGAYADDVSTQPLLAAKPVAGKITGEKRIPVIDVTELTLSNGVKVILKPTVFKNDEIVFNAFSAGGTSLYSDADFQSAANAAGITASSGLGNFTAIQLPKLLNGKQVGVNPFIGERSEGLNGGAVSKDFETALQLIYLYFTAPRKDSSIFQSIISRSKANMANRSNDPEAVFSDTVSAVLSNYNVRRTGPTPEKLSQVNLDKVYTIYKERFADAGDFTFLFVGNFDTVSIRPLLELYLGGLPSTGKKEVAKGLDIKIPAGKIKKEVFKGTEDKATVRLVISGEYSFSPLNNLKLEALKEVIEFHLIERLREAEGGVYSPSINVNYNKFVSRYAYVISFGCAPKSVEKLIAASLEEIGKIKQAGPSTEDIQKFIAEEKNSTETSLRSNGFWLNYLNSQYQDGENPTEVLGYTELLQKLTPEMIKATANEYMKGDNLIQLVLLPETK